MRSLLVAVALGVTAHSLSAQRAEHTLVSPATARASLPASTVSLHALPMDATKPFTHTDPRAAAIGVDGGRIIAIVLGAAIGAGIVYYGVRSMDCSDCDGDAATYGAIGGAVVGGFIGAAVHGFRVRKRVTPPSSIGS